MFDNGYTAATSKWKIHKNWFLASRLVWSADLHLKETNQGWLIGGFSDGLTLVRWVPFWTLLWICEQSLANQMNQIASDSNDSDAQVLPCLKPPCCMASLSDFQGLDTELETMKCGTWHVVHDGNLWKSQISMCHLLLSPIVGRLYLWHIHHESRIWT